MRCLEAGDGAERVVVHDHPDHRDVLLERGGERRRVLAEAAIADQRHDDAVGARDLGAQRGRGDPNPIVAKPPGVKIVPGV